MNITPKSASALALAFASLGDAFLYPFLPMNAAQVGVPLAGVGVLLSANRIVRICLNRWMVRLHARYGLRWLMVVSAAAAVMSTFGYGLAVGIGAWLVLRIVWGMSFSAMRLGTLAYALGEARPAFAIGISRGVQEAGPMAALFIGPLLLRYVDARSVFLVLGVLSLPALWFAWNLPVRDDKPVATPRGFSLQWPSALNVITMVSAMVVEGILVVVLGVLFLNGEAHIDLVTATAMAAAYLFYRRIAVIVLSPVGGWMADRFGFEGVLNVAMVCTVAGLLAIVSGWTGAGTLVVFTAYSVTVAVVPASASKGSLRPMVAVADNATWRDIGAASGTLLGGMLISSPYLEGVLLLAIFVQAFLLLIYLRTARLALKLLDLWK